MIRGSLEGLEVGGGQWTVAVPLIKGSIKDGSFVFISLSHTQPSNGYFQALSMKPFNLYWCHLCPLCNNGISIANARPSLPLTVFSGTLATHRPIPVPLLAKRQPSNVNFYLCSVPMSRKSHRYTHEQNKDYWIRWCGWRGEGSCSLCKY